MPGYVTNEQGQPPLAYNWVTQLDEIRLIAEQANTNAFIAINRVIRDQVVSVTDHGAKGDGVTDDTQAILRAIVFANGKLLYFPPGTYIVHQLTPGVYASTQFNLKSNTTVLFSAGANMYSVGPQHTNNGGFWGVDLSDGPVSNVKFINLSMVGPTLVLDHAIILRDPDEATGAVDTVTNILVMGCTFENWSCGVNLWKSGKISTDNRAVGNVKIVNNTFRRVQAAASQIEGKDVLFEGNYCEGDLTTVPNNYYDGVSIHCGVRVQILNNTFCGFNSPAGLSVNIRNADFANGAFAGSQDILVAHNIFRDNSNCSVSIALVPGETTYGVKRVIVDHNSITGLFDGIYIHNVEGDDATPFEDIIVSNNIVRTPQDGIRVLGKSTNLPNRIIVKGNDIYVDPALLAPPVLYPSTGLKLDFVFQPMIEGNLVYVINTDVNQHKVFECTNSGYGSITGNRFYAADSSINSFNLDSFVAGIVDNNHIQAMCNITRIGQVILNNNFTVVGYFEGVLITNVEWGKNLNGKRFYASNIAPSTGSWFIGEHVNNDYTIDTTCDGWVCTQTGTFGALVGATATTTSGSALFDVNNAALFVYGDYITIAGVTGVKRVLAIDTILNKLLVDVVCDASVIAAAVAYQPPTIKAFGATF